MRSTMQDGDLSIGRLVRHGTRVHGDAEVATWDGVGVRRRGFAELGERAARLAHALRALGVDADQRVATLMSNTAEHLEAYLAVPAMGAVLHTLNIRLFDEQLTYVVNHAQDDVLLVDAALGPQATRLLPTWPTVRHVVVAGGDTTAVDAPAGVAVHAYEELLAAAEPEFCWPAVDERSAAALCYTSGTTGDPKGVAYSHRSIWLHSLQACTTDAMALRQGDRILPAVPMFHAMAWGLPYAALMIGASLVLPDRFLQPEPLLALMAAERPTFAAAVPTIWSGVLARLDHHPQDVSHLREVIVAGAAVPRSLMEGFQDRHGVSVLHAWGMTETSPLGTVARPPLSATDPEDVWRRRVCQGRFFASVEARIVDAAGAMLPTDGRTVGELEVAGPWVTGSYLNDPAPEKFHDGWLRTGDVGSISPDGFFTLTDRAKDVIKSGGEWISSVELENLLLAHPAVAEAAVIGVPDPKWDERPLAIVVPDPAHQVGAEELRAFLAARVARWQVPENWAFTPELPRTSVGKLDKRILRTRHAEGAITVQRVSAAEAPREATPA